MIRRDNEATHPARNEMLIEQLKKEKLLIKERIERTQKCRE